MKKLVNHRHKQPLHADYERERGGSTCKCAAQHNAMGFGAALTPSRRVGNKVTLLLGRSCHPVIHSAMHAPTRATTLLLVKIVEVSP